MFMKVSALVGNRGFNFEYANGVLKVSVFRRTSESRTPKYRTVPTAVASYSLIHYPLYSRAALDQALTPCAKDGPTASSA